MAESVSAPLQSDSAEALITGVALQLSTSQTRVHRVRRPVSCHIEMAAGTTPMPDVGDLVPCTANELRWILKA
jgi:hypothetical protein